MARIKYYNSATGAWEHADSVIETRATDEQVATAVDEYFLEHPASGLTASQINALDGMFKIAAYTTDASAAYAAFKTAFGIGDVHTHSYTSTVTTAATCTTAGVRTYTCSCGHSYTETIPVTSHTYVDGVCSVCGAAESGGEETINILDGVTWTAGNLGRNGSTGEIISNGTNKYYTGFIPLNGATKLVCHASGALRQVGYFFTKESADSVVGAIALETVVSFYVSATNASYPSPVETAVPSGANYVIVQTQTGAVDNNELIIELA